MSTLNNNDEPENNPPKASSGGSSGLPADRPPSTTTRRGFVGVPRLLAAIALTARVKRCLKKLRKRFKGPAGVLLKGCRTLVPLQTADGEVYVVSGRGDELMWAPIDSDEGVRLVVEDLCRRGLPYDANAVTDLTKTLKHVARLGERIVLHRRFAIDGNLLAGAGELIVDMLEGRQVRITASGYRVEPYDGVRFQKHVTSQPIDGIDECDDLLKLVQEAFDLDQRHAILLIALLVAAQLPWATKPILMLVGDPGSGKTTMARMLVDTIDPSCTSALTLESKTLTQIASSRAVASFDNLAPFQRKLADQLCRCVTGAQEERRGLYTNRSPVLFEMKLWVILNGTDLPSHRTDLLDRMVILERQRREDFTPSNTLQQRQRQQVRQLRGGLYALLGEVLKRLPTVTSSSSDRMADFDQLGRIVALSLGLAEEDFSSALWANRRLGRSALYEDAPWLQLVVKVAIAHAGPEIARDYKPADLLRHLQEVGSASTKVVADSLPTSASWLSRELRRLEPTLNDRGVGVEFGRHSANERFVKVFMLPSQA